MSVLIKGMEMPKNCASCNIEQEVVYTGEAGLPYIGAHRCPLIYPSYTDESRREGLLPNCPLVPVPPHESERKRGEWIHDGYDIPHGVDWMHCSVCGRREPHVPAAMTNFCPTCGAEMRGKTNDD